jgi:hypothetical protein
MIEINRNSDFVHAVSLPPHAQNFLKDSPFKKYLYFFSGGLGYFVSIYVLIYIIVILYAVYR